VDEPGQITTGEGESRMLQQVGDVGRRTGQQIVQTRHSTPVGQ
jgi:hypothetical protein